MNDLEMIELCRTSVEANRYIDCDYCEEHAKEYNPLRFDEQAMALVKEFNLCVGRSDKDSEWWCELYLDDNSQVFSSDLNRAIVTCVTELLQAKASRPAPKS